MDGATSRAKNSRNREYLAGKSTRSMLIPVEYTTDIVDLVASSYSTRRRYRSEK